MLVHCNTKFRPEEIQFLRNNEHFSHRKLEIGTCPRCEHLLAKLTEKRIADGQWFETFQSRRKAKRLIKSCADDIEYTSLDVPKQTKCLYGFRYGENRERTNKDGTKTITQVACDFYGNKEILNSNTIQ